MPTFARAPGDPARDPGAERPAGAAPGEGLPRWPTAPVRPGALPAAPFGRARGKPAQAMATGGDALRKAGALLLGGRSPRLHNDLVTLVIRRIRPRSSGHVARG